MWSQNRISYVLLTALVLTLPGCGNQPLSKKGNPAPAAAIPEKGSSTTRAKSPDPSSPLPVDPAVASPVEPARNEASPRLSEPDSPKPSAPQPVFRPADERPRHDDQKLATIGIHRYESTRLVLYTDIDPQVARGLPPVIDQAYAALTNYFGPLPPDRARTEYQMTGYLIQDDAAFREAGLIPEDLPPFEHGRHRRNEFWMREQKYDYYRRHLLIHEATHCFMTVMPDVDAPVWYMEGMAEYFGTHRLADDGTVTFCVMPTSPEEFAGSGRITAIRNECAAGRARSIGWIRDLQPVEFLKTEHYAWAWGLTMFLDSHPRYQQRFRELGGFLQRNAFSTQFFRVFNPDARDLGTEWTLYIQNLQYGYDARQAAIDFKRGTELTEARSCEIQADRGWQSSGVLVKEGDSYEIVATGRFELAKLPVPWISEPQGISFRYSEGRPLGMLVVSLRLESDEANVPETMVTSEAVGRRLVFRAPSTGTLYLRVNDDWNSLHDNQGQVAVQISTAARHP